MLIGTEMEIKYLGPKETQPIKESIVTVGQSTRRCGLLNFFIMNAFSKVSHSISGKTSQTLVIRDTYI